MEAFTHEDHGRFGFAARQTSNEQREACADGGQHQGGENPDSSSPGSRGLEPQAGSHIDGRSRPADFRPDDVVSFSHQAARFRNALNQRGSAPHDQPDDRSSDRSRSRGTEQSMVSRVSSLAGMSG